MNDKAGLHALSRRNVLRQIAGASMLLLGNSMLPRASVAASAGTLRGAPSGALNVAVASLIDQSVDPFYQTGGLARTIGYHLFNMLFRFDDRGQRELDLAETFDISADRKTVTFEIRKDATFWDGSRVSAEDVAWSYETFVSRNPPQGEVPGLKRLIHSVKATGPTTVVMTLVAPTSRKTEELTTWWNISSKAHYNRVGAAAFRTQPMGTGPYKLVKNQIGAFIDMEANEGHYRKDRVPLAKALHIQVTPEVTTRIAQLRAGEVDIIDSITGVQAMQLAGDPGLKVFRAESTALLRINFFDLQRKRSPWTDIRLREALTISVNQAEIVQGLLKQGKPSPNAHVFPASKGYNESMFPVRKFDPQRAAALVKEAGLQGFSFDIFTYPSGSYPSLPEIAQALAGYWQAIGLSPRVNVIEAGTFIGKEVNRQMTGVGVQSVAFENDVRQTANWLITGFQWGTTDNFPELDQTYQQMLAETDSDKQIALALKMHKFCYDNYLFATGPWSNSQWAASSKAKEWIRPVGNPYTTRLESAVLAVK